jgi:predicted transcriptional regulator
MKATIEIPDELYRRVKAKSALQGRAIREVTIELYQHWLAENQAGSSTTSPEQWLEEWIRLGKETLHDAPPGPTATEILEADRGRLERPGN